MDIKQFAEPNFFVQVQEPQVRINVVNDLEKILFIKMSKLKKLEREVEIIQTLYTQICV